MAGDDGLDVEGYLDGPADGKLVGTLVVGREDGELDGWLVGCLEG